MRRIIQLKISSITILIVLSINVYSQEDFRQSFEFIQHLNRIKAYDEGIYFIEQRIGNYTASKKDTLFFYSGLFNYELKKIDHSIQAFESVSPLSDSLFIQSKFFSSFQYAYKGDYSNSKKLFNLDVNDDPFLMELKYLELAGVALLEREFLKFNEYENEFSGEYFQLVSAQDRLKLNRDGLAKAKNKSPALAGVMSGLIPGLGKFYVGKVGEGYLTLLISTIAGLGLREGYLNDGANSTRFKIYGGLFGALYVANIWGSVVSVKIYKDEVNKTYDEAILLNMHVPLRTIFD